MSAPVGNAAARERVDESIAAQDGCRDLLMHVKEHVFTLPRIAECLGGLGLTFLRMECEAHVRERFQEMFPAPGAETDLDAWHRFECAYPQSFKSMYQFWWAKKE